MNGQELASIRLKAGITQKQLASYCGLSRITVWRMETGRQAITRTIEWLAMHLKPGDPAFEEWLSNLADKDRQAILRRQHKKNYQLAILTKSIDTSSR